MYQSNRTGLIGDTSPEYNEFRIAGRQYPGASPYLEGEIDEVRVWNISRSDVEIAANYDRRIDPNTAGLVGYWRFDEAPANQNVLDLSPLSNNGTLGATADPADDDPVRTATTAPIYGPSPATDCNANSIPDECEVTVPASGSALQFDGVDDFVLIPGFGNAAPTSEITIELWQKADATGERCIFGLQDGVSTNRILATVPWIDGVVHWDFGDITTAGRLSYVPPTSIVGSWQHFAFVASQSGNHMRIYRNGNLEASKTGMTPFIRQDLGFRLAGASEGPSVLYPFQGTIDEFRIWNHARSQVDIQVGMKRRLTGQESGLVAYYRLDEGSGSTTANIAANSVIAGGDLMNGTAWAVSTAPIFEPDTAADCNSNGSPDECDISLPTCSICPVGPIINSANGHAYYLLPIASWTQSEALATGLGGHLVAINDQAENDWVQSTFSPFVDQELGFWIGLHQPNGSPEPAGGWTWSSGETLVFTNWGNGEPNNSGGTEDSAHMFVSGRWNDRPDGNAIFGVAEVAGSTDCNSNGMPDECELAGNDCNSNGVPDECDIATDLSVTNDMALWLRADLGVTQDAGGVTRWADQSGQGHHYVQNMQTARPLLQVAPVGIQNHPIVRLDGIDDSLSTPGILVTGNSFSIFTVMSLHQGGYPWAIGGPTGVGVFYEGYPWGSVPNLNSVDIGHGNSNDARATFPGIGDSTFKVLSVVATVSLSGTRVYVNGAPAAMILTGEDQTWTFGADGNELGRILNNPPSGYFYAQADFAEFLIYNRALNEAERQQVEQYLSHKYFGTAASFDCNSNGIPDECEPDLDSDGVPDDCDNCPSVPNPSQAASDADGMGDACDPCPNFAPAEVVRLAASDGEAGDQFGIAVAMDGDTAVVGAYFDDHEGRIDAGAAYVFVREGGVWTQAATLTASDAAANDNFGWTVAMSGETIVVGAFRADHVAGVDAGAAYVFVRDGGVWNQQAKLTAQDAAANDRFANWVAMDGDTAVIGSYQDSHPGATSAGSAYVFVRSGTSWTQQAKLLASDGAAQDQFGIEVSIDGDTAVIGAHQANLLEGVDAGAAYVFVRQAGAWTQTAKLTATDAMANDRFGKAVAVSGDTIVVGAHNRESGGQPSAGAAYVFTLTGGVWSETATLIPSDVAAGDHFGWAIGHSQNVIVAGSVLDSHAGGAVAGSANVFFLSGSTWMEAAKLTASDASDGAEFAVSLAMSGDRVLAGSYLADNGAVIDSGAAYVFELGVVDTDTDGLGDTCDNCPSVENPGQQNMDGDGAGDDCDGCPADPGKVLPGLCGCGVPETDTDLDGSPDCLDQCDSDPNKTLPGICGCDVPDIDTDSDGVADCLDGCPNDPESIAAGPCGCDLPAHYSCNVLCTPVSILAPATFDFTDDGGSINDSCDGLLTFRLFAGRTDIVTTGKVWRIRRDCTQAQFGALLARPESVLVDVHNYWPGGCGLVNQIIVGGRDNGGNDIVYFLNPTTGSVCEQYIDNTLAHIGQLALDSSGRLFIGSVEGNSLNILDKGVVMPFYTAAGQSLSAVCLDADQNVFVAGSADGVLRKLAPDGTVLNGSVATGLTGAIGMAFVPAGIFHDNLYVSCGDRVVEVNVNTGETTTLLSNLPVHGIAVDPDGYLHLSVPTANHIVKVGPALPGDMDGSGQTTLDDLDGFAGALLRLPDAPRPILTADMNGDGCADGRDVQLFVEAALGG